MQSNLVRGLATYGSETQVADHSPINHLAFYLKCVWGCGVLVFDVDQNLIDYNNAHTLSGQQQRVILETILHELNPQHLLNRVFFLDDQHMMLPAHASNAFFAIETVAPTLGEDILMQTLAGGGYNLSRIHKIMLCTSEWLEKYYFTPIYSLRGQAISVNSTLFGQPVLNAGQSLHCSHCRGGDDNCTCECGCPSLSSHSRCRVVHRGTNCFACNREIEGKLYKCATCSTIQVCEGCYEAGAHDMTHSVYCIERNGSTPYYIPPRVTAVQPPGDLAEEHPDELLLPTAEAVAIRNEPSFVSVQTTENNHTQGQDVQSSMPSSPAVVSSICAGQVVRLVGLSTEDMNGKEALVVSVKDSERVQVRLLSPTDQQDKIYSVRPKHMVPVVEHVMASAASSSNMLVELD